MDTQHETADAGKETSDFVSFDDLVGRFFEREPRVPMRAEFAARSDVGRVRKNNEDHYLVVRRYRTREILLTSLPVESLPNSEDAVYTVAVADGMGGREFGELAAFLALRTGWALGSAEVKWTVRINSTEAEEFRQKAEVFYRLIHKALKQMAGQNPRMAGMGTTLTLAYSTGPELFILHAGDSRAYLLRGTELTRLTRDHTMAQLLIDSGMAEPGSDLANKTKRVLINCLGASELGVDVDFIQYRLEQGDRIMLCSDGLTDMVDDASIARIMSDKCEPEAACEALVNAANQAGGKDNITVVVGRYSVDEEPGSPSGLTALLPMIKDTKPRKPRR